MALNGQPLQVLIGAEQRGRLEKIAADEGIKLAALVRELIADGLPTRERVSAEKMAVRSGATA